MVIAASDVAGQTLSENSWSLPGGPSGIPPQSWCRSARRKIRLLPLWIIARKKETRFARVISRSSRAAIVSVRHGGYSSRCHVSETREIVHVRISNIFPVRFEMIPQS